MCKLEILKKTSSRVFATPSFMSGAATVFDLFGCAGKYNYSRTPQEADRKAIASDWCAVGDDIQDAMKRYGADHNGKK